MTSPNTISTNVNFPTPFVSSKILISPTTVMTRTPTVMVMVGDANGDRMVDLVDFGIWKREYLGYLTTKTADFNNSGKVDLVDFVTWKSEYLN